MIAASQIRPATPRDADEIARVHVQSWNESFRGIVPDWSIDVHTFESRGVSWRNWLKRARWTTYVAEDRDGIVAFACAYPDTHEPGYDAYLNTLYVLQRAQRHGLASKLLNAIAKALLAQGHTSMWWLTLRENPACAFYERIGAKLLRDQPAPEELGPGVMDRLFGLDDLRILNRETSLGEAP